MQTKSAMEINPAEFSHRASIYLLGVASAYHVTPDEALKVILEAVSKQMMPSFVPVPRKGKITKEDVNSWLKVIGQDREWLASECGISKSAVEEWFKERRDIPFHYLLLIQRLMMEWQSARHIIKEGGCHA
ncbi:homeobox domain-containing protein [uncultured Akkermansia sp.]|uniref:homeobox domain-containing protein n=1 Tax=uncultured Akkermansia sp. TaxID=512294 RepID=UPI002582AB94|nr:homeobox domain-containing protein [uncultured Akkermansia sp.]